MLAGIAREAGATVRAFNRDSNLDVMDGFLTDGKRKVPVFALFQGSRELARWIERPAVAEPVVQEFRAQYPPAGSPNRDAELQRWRAELAARLDAVGAYGAVVREVREAVSRGLQAAD